MRRLIETILVALAVIIAGPVCSGSDHIEGFGE
jgi:hypothetical protein